MINPNGQIGWEALYTNNPNIFSEMPKTNLTEYLENLEGASVSDRGISNLSGSKKLCACGCEKLIFWKKYHKYYGMANYISGHNPRWNKGKADYINCLFCGGKVRTFKSRPRKYCNHICALKFQWKNNVRKKEDLNFGENRGLKKGQINSGSFTKERISGEKNPNWKGGISPENHMIRTSSIYKKWREQVFKRDDFTCQNPDCEFCNNEKGILLHAHHIVNFYWCRDYFEELIYDIDNGITYCENYHLKSKLHGGCNL